MTKQETAQQIVRQVLEFMVDNDYVESTYYPAGKNQADIAADDIEQLQDIAQASIEEFIGYVAKGTQRSK
jgi:phenylacetate-coenzyme A ligase PaaK-like adenylate-forming protein